MSEQHKPAPADDDGSMTPLSVTEPARKAFGRLVDIEPDLSVMVDDRRQWAKFWAWVQRVTHAIAEFAKWAVILGGAAAGMKALLAGWLK